MKTFFYIFLYLNIYTTFFYEINAQELHLKITASDKHPKETIDSLQFKTTFSNYLSLKNETDSIHNNLLKIGFIENKLLSLKKTNDSTFTASYFFGSRYHKIQLFYNKADFSKKELLQVSNNVTDSYFVIPLLFIEETLQKLTLNKTENGDAFARIRLEKITKDKNNKLTANIKITKNKPRTIDQIIVKGYDKFPKSFLKYYAGLKKGDYFYKEKVTKQSNALNSLGFVNNTKPPEILFKKDSTSIYLYLKKQKNNLFDGIIGFSNSEESQKLVLNGYLNLSLNNNLNFGEQFLLNYKADGEDQQNFRVKTIIPFILKTPLGIGLELKIFKRDSTFSTTEQEIRTSYQISPSANSYIGYKKYESSNLRNEVTENLIVDDYTSKFFQAGLTYKRQQSNNLFPLKTIFEINTEFGSRQNKNKKESQIRIDALILHIFNLNYKNSIYFQSNTKMLTSDSFLTNELYRFGGINSIRGFSENSIDASFYSSLNTEYRFQFNKEIYIHSIIDIAYFENQIISLKQKLYSFGIGVGLQSRIGILKFSIANGNTENQDFNFSNTKIHISISSVF